MAPVYFRESGTQLENVTTAARDDPALLRKFKYKRLALASRPSVRDPPSTLHIINKSVF